MCHIHLYLLNIIAKTNIMKKTKIEVPGSWTPELAEEFETTTQTVRMALQYTFNSEKAKKIRARAIERLEKESQKPVELR
mgnify:CR=1 FL=1